MASGRLSQESHRIFQNLVLFCFVLFCYITKHLMTRISMFPETKSRETLRFSGNIIHCSPRDQSLSVYCYPMNVEVSLSIFASAASDAFFLVLVPDPVEPQQSQTSLWSQAKTLPSSSAFSPSTSSSCDASPTYSHVVQSSPSMLIASRHSLTPPSSISLSASSKRIS